MHEKNREYNGYSNYETWNFMLWANNDEPTYNKIQALVKDAVTIHGVATVSGLADDLRELAHNEAPELKTNFYSEVMNASIREVDYYQVAEHLLEAHNLVDKIVEAN